MRQVFAKHNMELPEPRCLYYGAPVSSADAKPAIRAAIKELHESDDRPTAIFCGMLPDAEQVYLVASELGWRVPEDLSLIYFGGTWRSGALAERITCVAVDEQALGAKAAQLLEEMRFGNRPIDDDARVVFAVSLLDGETLARPSKSPAAPQRVDRRAVKRE
jgi:LacI family transcriptional regulator